MRKHILSFSLLFVATGLAGCNSFLGTNANATFNKVGGVSIPVQLSWAASTGSPTGYSIEESTDDVNFTQIATEGNVTTATVNVSSYSQTYYFRVRAFNQGGYSSYSPVATVTTPASG
jgi:hypothetical protein